MYMRRNRRLSGNNNGSNDTRTSINQQNINSRVSRAVNNQVRNIVKGSTFRPSLLPSLFDMQPWNNAVVRYVLSISATSLGELKVKTLCDLLAKQLGLYIIPRGSNVSTNIDIEVKIQKISGWVTSDGSVLIKFSPLNFVTPNSTGELCNISSMAQKNMYATVGYSFPYDHQVHIFQINKDFSDLTFAAVDVSANAVCEFHVHMLWRGMNSANIQQMYVAVPEKRKTRYKGVESDDEDVLSSAFDVVLSSRE